MYFDQRCSQRNKKKMGEKFGGANAKMADGRVLRAA